jgi:hypothetical protein
MSRLASTRMVVIAMFQSSTSTGRSSAAVTRKTALALVTPTRPSMIRAVFSAHAFSVVRLRPRLPPAARVTSMSSALQGLVVIALTVLFSNETSCYCDNDDFATDVKVCLYQYVLLFNEETMFTD